MKKNPLLKIQELGQSVWQDFLRRQMIHSGELKQLIEEDGLRGVTSNPKIFDKVIAGSHDYDEAIRAMALGGKSVEEIYQALTVEDVQNAADLFRTLYDESGGRHGFVSLEVNPHLAHDEGGTVEEARRLWKALDRPNVFIKVPATREGLPAIRRLISEGVNVNVTLLFGLPRYREVAEAYIAGMEERASKGGALERVASVASFFLSRIDVLVDPMLEKIMKEKGQQGELAERLHGEIAVASAKKAYQIYKELFHGDRFNRLAEKGARPQRVLWASTSTKNPDYSDVKYIEPLIGPETVNTMPQETLNAYRDHGNPAPRLEDGLDRAEEALNSLGVLGIDIDKATQQLEDEGVEKFNKPYDSLMQTLTQARTAAAEEPVDAMAFHMGEYEKAFRERVDLLQKERFGARLWRKDGSLWKKEAEEQDYIRNALGWLHVAEKMEKGLGELKAFAREAKEGGFKRVVHMGMGGSSLAPMVFERTFPPGEGGASLTVLDTTDPAAILDIERKLPLEETLFIVASKSGTTAEPLAFGDYFYEKVKALKGDAAGENFLAVTDPGTPLAKLADERGFRRTFLNFKDIGGRYSALSYFGLVPAALMGLDVEEILIRALRMLHACSPSVPAGENSGVLLGAAMGELARHGRNKVTFLMPEAIATLGMWLEQLIAESTGKEGTGLLPVAGEPLGQPAVYGSDRFFVAIRVRDLLDERLERGVQELREAGQPLAVIDLEDRLDIAQEFFRWEIATAAAGAILGINAFNQPNVQESKDNTKRLLEVVKGGKPLPEEKPDHTTGPLSLFTQGDAPNFGAALADFFAQVRPGDYAALLAYLTEKPEIDEALDAIRVRLRNKLKIAATVGYGPRFLHSTGQFHKGGPNSGLFIQLTADDREDMEIPDRPYTFGVLKRSQALGDLQALRKHGRRVVRIHLGGDALGGLKLLDDVLEPALSGGRS